MKPEKETKKHQMQLRRLTSWDEAPDSHQVRPELLEAFQSSYASSKVKNETDTMWNRISDDFDNRRISQPKTQ